MLEAGKKLRHLVQFSSGQPTSDLTYTLYNQDGDVVLSETTPIIDGQLSYTINIPAGSNTLTKPLFEQMTLEWEYDTAIEAVTDSYSYVLHAAIGFPVSTDGVRNMLGVSVDEVPDNDINLFQGYLSFIQLVGEDADLETYRASGDLNSFKVARSIEAATALALLPTLQLRLPKKYDSGTSSYERWTTIDWEGLYSEISSVLVAGAEVVTFDVELWPLIDIFGLSDVGIDPITGA